MAPHIWSWHSRYFSRNFFLYFHSASNAMRRNKCANHEYDKWWIRKRRKAPRCVNGWMCARDICHAMSYAETINFNLTTHDMQHLPVSQYSIHFHYNFFYCSSLGWLFCVCSQIFSINTCLLLMNHDHHRLFWCYFYQKKNTYTDITTEIESWAKLMCAYLNANNRKW